jgi:hypothetical protein
MQPDKNKIISKYMRKVLDEDPLTRDDLQLPKGLVDYLSARQDVLAQIYAFTGFREIMEVMIAVLIREGMIELTDIELHRVKQGRVIALKELLSLSKKAYDKIQKPKQNESTNEG